MGPLKPATAIPPSVEIRISGSGILVSRPTRIGRNTLSTVLMMRAPHAIRISPSVIDTGRRRYSATGTQTLPDPHPGTNDTANGRAGGRARGWTDGKSSGET